MSGPTHLQQVELRITERVCSVLSLTGITFIILTFSISPAFRKPINRLIVYACCGNLIANIATMMSTVAIHEGANSTLCQLQAFMIQWFLAADALWALAMACNVYLTFFRRFDQHQLRALEWKYLLLCNGVPAIPAFVFLFIQNDQGTKLYGPAVIWCWISNDWAYLRVATFYGPIWIIMLATFSIWIYAGLEIFKKRRQLKNFSDPRFDRFAHVEGALKNSKTTVVEITSEPMQALVAPAAEVSSKRHNYQPYSITIKSSGTSSGGLGHGRTRTPGRVRAVDANVAAWGYARVAFFFFLAMLVTYVPSSVNRMYGLAHPDKFNFPLQWVTSMVMPLQGFWNSIIYISTSIPACRALWYRAKESVCCAH
ncbi:MAG: hypothetical protein M1838_005876 [Thelocarpon superellum]|nr:MAG: hypothetical protein M1838_005876 [Thelocarpon superellum]